MGGGIGAAEIEGESKCLDETKNGCAKENCVDIEGDVNRASSSAMFTGRDDRIGHKVLVFRGTYKMYIGDYVAATGELIKVRLDAIGSNSASIAEVNKEDVFDM